MASTKDPQGSTAAHVLGFVDSYGNGKVGMEEVFDKRLKSDAGRATPMALSVENLGSANTAPQVWVMRSRMRRLEATPPAQSTGRPGYRSRA